MLSHPVMVEPLIADRMASMGASAAGVRATSRRRHWIGGVHVLAPVIRWRATRRAEPCYC